MAAAMLQESVSSVFSQSSRQWELILLDYAFEHTEQIKEWEQCRRVSILKCGSHEDITIHLNQAVETSSAKFFLGLHPYDTLSPNAISEIVQALNRHPDTDIFYSDEDKITRDGVRLDPFFKPDWSPDFALSFPAYPGTLLLFKKQIVQRAGGFAKGFEACAEYDLMLRAAEMTDKIVHIPRILYHRRETMAEDTDSMTINSDSMAEDIKAKNINSAASPLWNCGSRLEAAERSLEAAVVRRGEGDRGGKGKVQKGLTGNSFRISFSYNPKTLVSIIIPFRDHPEILETAVDSILNKTSCPNYEIICVNNRSRESRTFALIDRLNAIPRVTVIHDDSPFNYSALNNKAISHAGGDLLLFLNSDTEVISAHWLEAMMEHACRKEVGAVGAKLYFVNDTIQHAGILLGVAGPAGHAFKHVHMNDTGYYHGLPSVVRNVSGVTGACMMIRHSLFEEIGGFDEENFQVSYNDLDLCLRLRQSGYHIIYTPFAELYHYESYSRGYVYDYAATQKLRNKWGNLLDADPFYNPNLTTIKEDWSLNQ